MAVVLYYRAVGETAVTRKGWYMKNRLIGFVLILGLLLGMAATASAAGFGIYEWSTRGNALGGAMVGRADDPSALAYNPAGITQLPGTQILAGTTFITPTASVDTSIAGVSGTEDAVVNTFIIPHFYITQQITDDLYAGLGLFCRYGLGTEYDSNWIGRYNITKAFIDTFSINPNIAYKVTDEFSVAVGLELMYFSLDLGKRVNGAALFGQTANPFVSAYDANLDLTGSSWGVGFNVGLHYKFNDQFSAGISYRSQVDQKVEGEADWTKSAAYGANPLSPVLFNDCDVEGRILLPDSIAAGIMYKPMEELSIELGLVWTRWSTYKELSIDFDTPFIPGFDTESETKKNWHDTWRFNVGVEYSPTDWLDLRASYVYDQSPIDDDYADYLIPSSNRHLIGLGAGFHTESFSADIGYTLLIAEHRNVDARLAEGIYDSEFNNTFAHIIGLSFAYTF